MLKNLRLLVLMLLSIMIIETPVSAAELTKKSPGNSNFKAWMDYRACRPSSAQGKLQGIATTDANGIRIVNGRYCVALGTYFATTIGTPVDVQLSTGKVLPCILGDVKANQHTDSTNRQSNSGNGNVVEFIVDKKQLPQCVKQSGSIHSLPGFEGDVISITVHVPDSECPIVPGEVEGYKQNVGVHVEPETSSTKTVSSNSISSNNIEEQVDEKQVIVSVNRTVSGNDSTDMERVSISYSTISKLLNRNDEYAVYDAEDTEEICNEDIDDD